MKRQPTFEQMEDKREVRGIEYMDGEWTGRFFQPTLLCKHQREFYTLCGWILNENSNYFGDGCKRYMQFYHTQECELCKA